MSLASGDAPLTEESQSRCRLRLVGKGLQMDVPFSDADRARSWGEQLMARARCDLEPLLQAQRPNGPSPLRWPADANCAGGVAGPVAQLWRLVAMVLLSGGFAWILLRHGWTLRGPDAVLLQGGASLQTNQVVEAAKLRFPQPLLRSAPGRWNSNFSALCRCAVLRWSARCCPPV